MKKIVNEPVASYGSVSFELTIPRVDIKAFEEYAKKMGWQIRLKQQTLSKFVSSCEETCTFSDEEIQKEVNAIRYAK